MAVFGSVVLDRKDESSKMLIYSSVRGASAETTVTLLQESAAVVNNTMLWAMSSDASNPLPLSPATLLEHPNHIPLDTFSDDYLDANGPCKYRKICYLAEQFWIC